MTERDTVERLTANEFLADFQKKSESFIAQDRFSRNTKIAYELDFRYIHNFLKSENVISWESIDDKTVQKYIVTRRSHGAGDTTIYRSLNAFRSFLGYLHQDNQILNEKLVDKFHLDKHSTKPISENEYQLLEDKAKNVRDKIILGLLRNKLSTTEVSELQINQLKKDPATNEYDLNLPVRKHSTHKNEPVHLDSKYSSLVESYLNQRNDEIDNNSYLIVNSRSKSGDRITRQNVWLIVHKLGKKCQMDINSRNLYGLQN